MTVAANLLADHHTPRGRRVPRVRVVAGGAGQPALGVDADNETGALGVYRAMGFEERTRETDFRKPFPVAEMAR